jgi:pyridoxal/pyridoxine/pyridoxamine kinase
LGALIDGLKNNGLEFYDYAVSGYIGSVGFLEKLATVMMELKEKNPDMVKIFLS